MFNSVSFGQISDIKYCTFHKQSTQNSNETKLFRYICPANELCCNRGNGCCPTRPNKYYESIGFCAIEIRIFIFGVTIACYLLCWYCKKLEKRRQSIRHAAEQGRVMPSVRLADANNVDRLLETLILSYRSRLMQSDLSIENLDEIKVVSSSTESPPDYAEAVKMPRPDNKEAPNRQDEPTEFDLNDDQSIPDYEDAIKNL